MHQTKRPFGSLRTPPAKFKACAGVKETALKYNVSNTTAYRWMKLAGVKMRPGGRPSLLPKNRTVREPVADYAARHHVSAGTVYKWIRDGAVKQIKVRRDQMSRK